MKGGRMPTRTHPIQPGEPAPAFTKQAVNREGAVSLEDFRGRRGILVGFFRGLHCPFCRRQIATLGSVQPALAEAGVETVAVVNTPLERARLYFRHRPTPVTLLSDPECRTHAAFGVPRIGFAAPGERPQWPTTASPEDLRAARINPTGELPEPLSPLQANEALNEQDGFALTATDREIFAAHGMQLAGHFLVDRDAMVRWSQTEAPDAPADLARFPAPAALVAAARILAGAAR
jgi:peroxiredoxin